jgi:hypothetical protein
MTALNLFIPITKVEAAQRLVYGVATAECEDRAGEICDYATTKPFYEKWSRDIEKATDGRSLGNLRAMHGRVAAGKITSLTFDDEARQIEICAKVVDDAEWDKVCEGVYTGFSQGGSYVKRWKDECGLTRYTADPSEVSLVDLPCLPSATFQMVKADGETEELRFKTAAVDGDEWEQVWKSRRDGSTFRTKAELRRHHDELDAMAKRGARNSESDLKRIQNAHDALVELGAQCGASQKAHDPHAPGGGADALAKFAEDREAMRKALAAIAPVLDEILQRVKTIEAQPAPLPFSGRTRAVSKGQELLALADSEPEDVAKFIAANREALAVEAIKLAQRRPQTMGARR